MNRTNRTGLAALLVALLASCVQPNDASAQPAGDGFEFDDTEWVLGSLNGEPLLKDTNITLEFKGESFNGYSGCNWYGGPYTVTETAIDFVDGGSTARACNTPTEVMQQEETYGRALYRAATYRATDDHLELANGAGDVTLAFTQKPQLPMNPADLVGTKWRLRAVSGDDLPADALVTLNFPAAGVFNGVLGCIDYSGKYTAEGDDIWFGEYGHRLRSDVMKERS